MSTVDDLFPSRFLKAEADFADGEAKNVVIESWTTEELGQGSNKESKPILFFKGIQKGLVLNKTNAEIVARMHGRDLDKWAGKKVTLFTVEVDAFGDIVKAIRVKDETKRRVIAPASDEPDGVG